MVIKLAYPWIMRNCVTIHGQWMYPQGAVGKLIGLISSELLSLDNFEISTFGIDQANEAIEHAAANAAAGTADLITLIDSLRSFYIITQNFKVESITAKVSDTMVLCAFQ